jgi:hypothetical protein
MSLKLNSLFRSQIKSWPCICWFAAAIALAFAGSVRADSMQDDVLGFSGPTYAIPSYGMTVTGSEFCVNGTVGGIYSPTDIVDPNENDNAGSFSVYINLSGATVTSGIDPDSGLPDVVYTLANTQSDYLTEQIYVSPTDHEDVLESVNTAGQQVEFGVVDFFGFNWYWFAFQGKEGNTIGGYLLPGLLPDVKTFDLTAAVPAPSSALGGLVLMAALGLNPLWSRLFNRRPLSLPVKI